MLILFAQNSSPTLRIHTLSLACPVLFLLTCATLLPDVFAQTANTRPVARLVSSTSNTTRPRRAISVSDTSVPAVDEAYPTLPDANTIERRAFEQTNLVRLQNGLAPFVWDPALCYLARNHSENMARLGFFAHVTPEGSRLRDRARAVGITHFSVLGENIARSLGYDDPGAFAVERWMISPDHRANILDAGFQAMAIGTFVAADGSVFLTQVFIKR